MSEDEELMAVLDWSVDPNQYLSQCISFIRTFAHLLELDKEQFTTIELLEALDTHKSKLCVDVHARIAELILNRKTQIIGEDAVDKAVVRILEDRKRRFIGPEFAEVREEIRNAGGYFKLDRQIKLCVLANLCDWAADESEAVKLYVDELGDLMLAEKRLAGDIADYWLETGANPMPARNLPMGWDAEGRAYWYFDLHVNKPSFAVFRTGAKENPDGIELVCESFEEMQNLEAALYEGSGQRDEEEDNEEEGDKSPADEADANLENEKETDEVPHGRAAEKERKRDFEEQKSENFSGAEAEAAFLYQVFEEKIMPKVTTRYRKEQLRVEALQRQMEMSLERSSRRARMRKVVNYRAPDTDDEEYEAQKFGSGNERQDRLEKRWKRKEEDSISEGGYESDENNVSNADERYEETELSTNVDVPRKVKSKSEKLKKSEDYEDFDIEESEESVHEFNSDSDESFHAGRRSRRASNSKSTDSKMRTLPKQKKKYDTDDEEEEEMNFHLESDASSDAVQDEEFDFED